MKSRCPKEKYFSALSPVKTISSVPGKVVYFIILVTSINDNRCPRKNGSSSLYYILLFIVPASLSGALLFVPVKLSRKATLLGKSLSFCPSCLLSEKCFVVFYVFYFPLGVYVGTLNLIASIPGPSIFTLPIRLTVCFLSIST